MSKTTTTPKAKASSNTGNSVSFANLDLKSAETTIKWMEKVGLEEIELEQNDTKIRLKRPSLGAIAPAAPAAAPQAAPAPAAKPTEDKNTFKSPIVGTFYRSASPEGAPFVNVGDRVKAGQTLCIIEAMKTMNQVEAEQAGVIKQVLAENTQPVEFGDALFIIE